MTEVQKKELLRRAKRYIRTLPLYKSQPNIINDKSIQDIFIAGYMCNKRQRTDYI